MTCTGCGACSNACPVNAVKLLPDQKDGFYRPTIDYDRCVKCMKCEKSCPVISPVLPYEESDAVYAVWNKDAEIRRNSSSGGAFSALAQAVLDEGGIVIGAAYTENLHLKHVAIDRTEDLELLRASKYVQSETGLIFREAIRHLQLGRKVLFCGTPCQVTGFKAFLGAKSYENLLLVDFICHGVPSPFFFQSYLKWLSRKYGRISNFRFRDKKRGWYDALRVAMTDVQHYMKGKDDCYWVAYNNNNNLQEVCYGCKFLGTKRNSDITISDFWSIGKRIPFGHKKEISKGVSMVMVNTPSGAKIFEQAKKHIDYQQRALEEVILGNQAILRSSLRPKNRSTFYVDLGTMEFEDFLNKYLIPDKKTQLVKIFREYMPTFIVKFIRSIQQK
ncbi:MAG: Coenzyme F420 hydrogenase/dehydrogenase, beta subunit C-terminal domain [Prevotellaceae bacterium]|nr:Coenzyme F420 hydrogenase/dehydrogenase, beta subunit C-terminal domain [Prevotellaceae bacterium]